MGTIPQQATLTLDGGTASPALTMRGHRVEADSALVRAVADGTRGLRITARNESAGWDSLETLQAEGCAYAVPLAPGLLALDLDHSNGALSALVDALEGAAVVCESGGTVAQPAAPGESALPRLHVILRATPSEGDVQALRGLGVTVRVGDGGPPGGRMLRPPTAPHRHGLTCSTVRGTHSAALARLEGPDRTPDLTRAVRAALAHGDAAQPPPASPWAGHRGLREGHTRAVRATDGPEDTRGESSAPAVPDGPQQAADEHPDGVLPEWLREYAAQPHSHRRTALYRIVCWALDHGWTVGGTVAALESTALWGHYVGRAARSAVPAHEQASRHVAGILRDRGRQPAVSGADLAALDRMGDAVAAHPWATVPGRPRGGTLQSAAVAIVAIARRAGRWTGLHVAVRDLAERAGVSRGTAQRAMDALHADGLLHLERAASGTAAAVWALDPWHPALRATHATPAAPEAAAGPQHDGWRHGGLGHAARRVWAALATLGGTQTATPIAALLGYSHPSTARQHLRRLRDAGLVTQGPDGWAVADGTAAALDRAAESMGTAGRGAAVRAEHRRQRDGWAALVAERQRREAEDRAAWESMRAHGGESQPHGTPWVPPSDGEASAQPDGPPPLPPPGPRPWDGVPPAEDPPPLEDREDAHALGLAA